MNKDTNGRENIKAYRLAIQHLLVQISKRNQRLVLLKIEAQTLRVNHEHKNTQIHDLELGLQERDTRIVDLSNALQAKDAQIAGFNTTLRDENSRIAELNTTLQAKDSRIAELTTALQAKNSRIAELNTALQAKGSQIAELNTALQSKNSQIDRLDIQIQQIQHGVGMQLLKRYRGVVEKVLGTGTRRRHYYELLMKGVRVILNEEWRSFFKKTKNWWQHRKAARGHVPNLTKFKNGFENLAWRKEVKKIIFPQPSHKPKLSIVIPVYNKWQYTLKCLKSLSQNTEDDYEVIVVDDASSDETDEVLSKITNLHLMRNQQNAGFIESCNRGAKAGKGNYVLFLNNDTIVAKNWLRPLLELIRRDDVGAVGAKLIYPNGKLQEAGSIIWSDGSGWNYGRGDDLEKPEYNYVREVDYCSGACLLVKRELLERIGGLDERFKPAYYEDTDLCFSLRDLGYKVMYQPMSVITHFEGVTSGTDTSSGIKRYQEINRLKFIEKWHDVLAKHHHLHDQANVFVARDRSRGQRVLVIDHYVPTYDKDSGSMRMSQILKILSELGHKVTFVGDNLLKMEPYTRDLQREGIEVIYAPHVLSITDYLRKFGSYFNVIVLSRSHIAIKYIDLVKSTCPAARIVFDTVDLNFLRESRRAKIENNRELLKQAEESKTKELYLARNCDVTLVVSPVEKDLLLKENPSLNIEIISNIHHITQPTKSFSEREDILFVGGFDHIPNVDSVTFFVKDIFPLIKQKLPGSRLYIVGNNPPNQVLSLRSHDIEVTGYVKDLNPYFEKSRVFVAPLRYGAGVKGKINQSMSYGLPVVTTTIGAEGIGLVDGVDALIADEPGEFAEKVAILYNSESLWHKLSVSSIENVRKNYSPEVAREKLKYILDNLMM